MRGKETKMKNYDLSSRITPAYAGKSFTSKFPEFHHGDHPRLCGEKFTTSSSVCIPKGSPPPMRGKAAKILKELEASGITPAYAGKSRQNINNL